MAQLANQQARTGQTPALNAGTSTFASKNVASSGKQEAKKQYPVPFRDLTFEALEKNLEIAEEPAGTYRAALGITGRIIPLPIIVAFVTALLYISPPTRIPLISPSDNTGALLYGFLLTGVLWLITSFFCKSFTTFSAANVQSSSHIKRHLLVLQSVLLLVKERSTLKGPSPAVHTSLASFRSKNPEDYDLAVESMYQNTFSAINQLKNKDVQCWIKGTGYLQTWNFILLAEEAMLIIIPRESVIREALHDEAAINGADIALHDIILSNIKIAVKKLSPTAGIYLKSLSAQDRQLSPSNGTTYHKPDNARERHSSNARTNVNTKHPSHTSHPQSTSHPLHGAATSTNNPSSVVATFIHFIKSIFSLFESNFHSNDDTAGEEEEMDATTELEARNALRDARQTLNDFRASQWDGLVCLRNQMFGTSLFTAFLTYTLLCTAIISGVEISALKAALFFYLVGATVGLFSRLYTERQSDSAIDDYGLAIARVTVTPILSGLAAIAGVLVVSYLSLNLFNTPGTPTNVSVPSLVTVYDLVKNQQGIIVAAIFGFAPNLFINVLQQKANDATTKLKNSAAPSSGN